MEHTTTIKEKRLTPRTVDPPRGGTHRDSREAMQKGEAQRKTQEKISLGAMMLTIAITNAAVFLYLAPYA